MARPCLADEERRLCHECALEAASALPLAHRHPVERPCPVCGTSTGAAAALIAAAELGSEVGAVVSRGGRPDLAAPRLVEVRAPTLLIVGGDDLVVLRLNR